ncbi:MAG: tyrosine-type recombinase/integrase [Limimaricola soesokkakensis]|uniref:tyrosine-type recombinase/integrase n=1 Tax=Limimaricola soesokkakensis TaxID=1343159 RepID=UPI004059F1A1
MSLKLFRRSAGGAYYMRGTVQGNHVYESTRTGNRREAEAIAHRREIEIRDRYALGRAATLTFAEAALDYMGAGGERRFLGPILEHFGPDMRLRDVDNAAVTAAAQEIYPQASTATINRQLVTPISAVYAMAADQGLVDPRRFKRRRAASTRRRWLTPEEAEALIAAATPSFKPTLGLLLGSGVRAGEAVALAVQDFHPDTGEAWLQRTKTDAPRMIWMPRRAVDLVLSRPLPDLGPVLRTRAGAAYAQVGPNQGGQFKTAFHRTRTAAGLGTDVTPHVLRHTWATWYYAATRDFGGLIDLGGWTSADMANHYRKMAPADLPARLLAHGWEFNTRFSTNPT